jgi:hypothetical protein
MTLAYSKQNKQSYETDVPRRAGLKEWFGKHLDEDLTPKEIEKAAAASSGEREVGTIDVNHYRSLMSLSYRLGIWEP